MIHTVFRTAADIAAQAGVADDEDAAGVDHTGNGLPLVFYQPALKGSPFLSWSFTLNGLVAKRPTSSFSARVRYFFHLHADSTLHPPDYIYCSGLTAGFAIDLGTLPRQAKCCSSLQTKSYRPSTTRQAHGLKHACASAVCWPPGHSVSTARCSVPESPGGARASSEQVGDSCIPVWKQRS